MKPMKDFLFDCLENLEALTGKGQLRFWANDPDGAQKRKVCLMGMKLACADYPFIPDEDKQRIIRDQMVKDQNYEQLNAQVIHRWLSAAARSYQTHSQFSEEDLLPRDQHGNPAEAAPPEVADKYLAEFKASLVKIGTPQRPEWKVAKREEYEPSTTPEEVHKRLLHSEYLRQNYHPITQEKLPGWMSEEEWLNQKQTQDVQK